MQTFMEEMLHVQNYFNDACTETMAGTVCRESDCISSPRAASVFVAAKRPAASKSPQRAWRPSPLQPKHNVSPWNTMLEEHREADSKAQHAMMGRRNRTRGQMSQEEDDSSTHQGYIPFTVLPRVGVCSTQERVA